MDQTAEAPTQQGLDRQIIKEIGFPRLMTVELVDRWAEGIPKPDESIVPEFTPTDTKPLDLGRDGEVWVKDESSNPTGTIKDRPAWELATVYRDHVARKLWLGIRAGKEGKEYRGRVYRVYDGVVYQKRYASRRWEPVPIPKVSVVTSGNEGRALAECFERYGLPPPKLIVGEDTDQSIVEALRKLRADIYMLNLQEKELTPQDILKYTNNTQAGIELTSNKVLEPEAIFYDWHVHETFNQEPDMVFVPFGSGRLLENYLYWIKKTGENYDEGKARDSRLTVEPDKVAGIRLLGAEPEELDSDADKLSAAFKPFRIFKDTDLQTIDLLAIAGEGSGVYKISEDLIQEAYALLRANNFQAEPSAAAGLALYLKHFREGLIQGRKKVIIINTGRGLEATRSNKIAA